MGRGSRLAAFGIGVAVLSAAIAGGALAGERATTKDRRVLQPVAQRLDPAEEARITALMARMTLEEKLNQLTLLSDGQMKANPAEARNPVGGVFSETDPVLINRYQRDAVENSRLGIPILFAFDTIHGFRTIFPIPLGAASSFDPAVAEADHRIGAFESAAVGLKQIYSPMVDVSHDPRWGRISEAAGEDPYLNSVMAAARVRGAQGSDYAAPDKVVTSVKHFAAYGQPEAGRDYNTTDMSLHRLWNFYLPPFKAAVEAGSDTLMCSFNAINGVPGCANRYLETTRAQAAVGLRRLRRERLHRGRRAARLPGRGPRGRAVRPRRTPRTAATRRARRSGPARTRRWCPRPSATSARRLVASGQVPLRRIDDAVRRILRVKVRAGLFENPYVDVAAAPGQAAPAREPRRRPPRGRPLHGPAGERGRRAAARPGEVDGDHRPAGRQRPRHARAVVGARRRRGRRLGLPGDARPEPEHDVHARLHAEPQRALRPGQRMRVRRRLRGGGGRRATRPTRSCSPWARRAR